MGLTGTELQPALQDEVARRLMRGLPKPIPVNPMASNIIMISAALVAADWFSDDEVSDDALNRFASVLVLKECK